VAGEGRGPLRPTEPARAQVHARVETEVTVGLQQAPASTRHHENPTVATLNDKEGLSSAPNKRCQTNGANGGGIGWVSASWGASV